MSARRVVVTGGAGFIGSHLVDRLVDRGDEVVVLDIIEPQVHGDGAGIRNAGARYVEASVLDTAAVRRAITGAEAVVHLAAQVGVGQSMYEMQRYVRDNCLGTAALLETIKAHGDSVGSLVVASSMSIYGEGLYRCPACGLDDERVGLRPRVQLEWGHWEPACSACEGPMEPAPTPEDLPLQPDSVYATTKRDQEELCLSYGRAYDLRTVALRFFNVYGARQSLSNPYTGVAAIFASRLLNGERPLVFEDGLQARDFVSVRDVVRAIERAVDGSVGGVAVNVGTGRATTVLEVGRALARHLGADIEPEVTERFRLGDIRHCIADVTRARTLLGYEPTVDLDEGMQELVAWILRDRPPAVDQVRRCTAELEQHGLVV